MYDCDSYRAIYSTLVHIQDMLRAAALIQSIQTNLEMCTIRGIKPNASNTELIMIEIPRLRY